MKVMVALSLGICLCLPAASQAAPGKLRPVRPVKVLMEEKRKEIREYLLELLRVTPDAEDRPVLLFRLAEIYLQEALAHEHEAQELDKRLARDPENERLRQRIEARQRILREESERWHEREIALYREIVADYPDFPDRDRVLFHLGTTLEEQGREREGLVAYRELIQSHPGSRHVPDTYVAFGEHYFGRGVLDRALEAYRKAAASPDTSIRGYAIYMQGWVHYNLHDFRTARRCFEHAAARPGRLGLRDEALVAYTRAYAQDGDAGGALADFRRLSNRRAHVMLVRLAGLYFSTGQYDQAVVTYRTLIREEKCSPEIPFYQARILEVAERLGQPRRVVREVRELTDAYAWAGRCLASPTPAQGDAARLREAGELIEETLRRLAVTWTRRYHVTWELEILRYALELYGDYLQLFPDSPDAYDMRFAYAELLYHQLKSYERAATEYGRVAIRDGPRRCDAAHKALEAADLLMKHTRASRRGRARGLFLSAAERYLKLCPDEVDVCDVRMLAADARLELGPCDRSVPLYDRVVRECQDEALVERAVQGVVGCLEEEDSPVPLEKRMTDYLKVQKLQRMPKVRAIVEEAHILAHFGRAERLEGLAAGRIYLLIADAYPRHELSDDALYSAAVAFESIGHLDVALQSLERLLDAHPRSKLAPASRFRRGHLLERMARYQDAAREFERHAQAYRRANPATRRLFTPADVQVGLVNAGIYREALGELLASTADRLLYAELFPRSADTPRMLEAAAVLHAKQGRHRRAARIYLRITRTQLRRDPDRAIAAHMYRAEQLMKLGRGREAQLEMRTAVQLYESHRHPARKLPHAARAAAKAKYLLAGQAYASFARAPLTARKQSKLKRQLERKLRVLERVAGLYTSVAKMAEPEWAIASLVQMGRAYENLGRTLEKIGLPDQVVAKISQKAEAHYEIALAKSFELSWYSPATLTAARRLEVLRPDKYTRMEPGYDITAAGVPATNGPGLIEVLPQGAFPSEPAARPSRRP